MANPTTNFGWVMPTSTDLVTDLPADFAVFGQGVDTSLAELKGGTTGQVLSKTSNTDMDFTWVAQDDSNAIQNAIVDAKGDLIAATAADTPARLAVGTNGQVLTADSTAATGIKWAAAAGGSMTLLSTTSISGAATITISSISQAYKNLYVEIVGINVTTGTYTLKIRPNGANTSNYSSIAGSVVADPGSTYISPGNAGHSGSSTVNDFALTFYNYADTTNYKPFSLFGISKMASQVEPLSVNALGAFKSASAITSIEFNNDSGGNFTAGTCRIYGVN